jgi:hypothetical protein
MRETARRLCLEAATAALVAGIPQKEIPAQLAKWTEAWLQEK